jgi:hypothetical protein
VKILDKRDYLLMIFPVAILLYGIFDLIILGIRDPLGWVFIVWAILRISLGVLFPLENEERSEEG